MEPMGAIIFLPRESDNRCLMLDPILLDPAALWLSAALERQGVSRFFVVCHPDDLPAAAPCFPEGTAFFTTDMAGATERLLAFLDGLSGPVSVITRPVFLGDEGARTLVYESLPKKGDDTGVYRVESLALAAGLAEAAGFEDVLRQKGSPFCFQPGLYQGLMPIQFDAVTAQSVQFMAQHDGLARLNAGFSSLPPVRVLDPDSIVIGPRVQVGGGTVLLPGTILRGNTVIGQNCEIGPNAMIRDCTIGSRVTVNASQLNESTVDDDTKVGPFAYIRPHCHVGKDVKVGDFVELKNSVIGDGTKISHLTYVGDSDVGSKVNFGCGTVTVNYDGSAKFRTTIGDRAFIGCNSNLVAPVKIGVGAYTAAGSTITDDVPDDSLAIARAPQTVKVQWAAKRRRAKEKK